MTLNELIQGLNKITQFAGELPVVIHNAETEAETVLHSIGISIDPAGTANGKVTINHGTTPAPAVPAAGDPGTNTPTDPADPTTPAQ